MRGTNIIFSTFSASGAKALFVCNSFCRSLSITSLQVLSLIFGFYLALLIRDSYWAFAYRIVVFSLIESVVYIDVIDSNTALCMVDL
jgi:hypothetical protein